METQSVLQKLFSSICSINSRFRGAPRAATVFLCAGLALWAARPCSAAPGGTLVHPRYLHAATLLADGRVLLVGGLVDPNFTVSGASEIYNPATNSWAATGSLNQARYFHKSVLLPDGRVLAMGGQAFGANIIGSAELYNPATGTWAFTASMITARFAFDPILLPNGKVLVAGGFTPSGTETTNCELYDPAAGSWSPTGSLLQPRTSYHATLLADGRVLVAGGFSQAPGLIAESELYDPATGTWSNSGTLNNARYNNVQVRLADGRVLIAGGITVLRRNRLSRTAEIYDPATGVWTFTGPLKTRRIEFTANLLNDGKVFAAGGGDGTTQAYDSIEEFNPASGRWRTLPTALDSPRRLHTTITLPDGSLIVAGGADSSLTLIPTAELFVRQR